MKMVFIAYDEAHDRQVIEVLRAAGAEGFTRWTEVQGKGRSGGPHLGTPVWPKRNRAILAAVEDHQAAKILEAIRSLRQSLTLKGLKAFVLPIEDAT